VPASLSGSGTWKLEDPALESDKEDPLLLPRPYGAFMMGFDFHLTPEGPKLIEINTNAGGLATVFTFAEHELIAKHIQLLFLSAILKEYEIATEFHSMGDPLQYVVIVDDNVNHQKLYPEMLKLASIIEEGVATHAKIVAAVVSPEDLKLEEDGLYHNGNRVQFIYNRMTDFRMTNPEHNHIREASLKGLAVLSPHPSAYVRYADKRNLCKITHPLVPKTYLLSDKPIEEWGKIKKSFVFKPPDGAASKGVYRGDKISQTKLQQLPPNTIAQEYCPPGISEDHQTKYDLRIYTRDCDILGIASRHFCGQVMEMSSALSGFKAALPEGVCCFPMVVHPKETAEFVKECVIQEGTCKDPRCLEKLVFEGSIQGDNKL
jgi:hypothetical protein